MVAKLALCDPIRPVGKDHLGPERLPSFLEILLWETFSVSSVPEWTSSSVSAKEETLGRSAGGGKEE